MINHPADSKIGKNYQKFHYVYVCWCFLSPRASVWGSIVKLNGFYGRFLTLLIFVWSTHSIWCIWKTISTSQEVLKNQELVERVPKKKKKKFSDTNFFFHFHHFKHMYYILHFDQPKKVKKKKKPVTSRIYVQLIYEVN